ncbi:ORC-CDC6 family AAA ATPase [Microbacterium sp. BR1]|uniref:ORC-CDC6 family AAA ATPase n=1 Tax=Microbacterium sp. BR1 TaxID=1070896 RepID=UPI003FA58492
MHSVLSGPRGSGKTTLLKMLQPEALERWHHTQAESMVGAIDYTGVFVATDRIWKQQLEPDTDELDRLIRDVIAESAFATQVARELVTTMAWRAHSIPENTPHHARARLTPADELLLVRELSSLLRLRVEVPRIESVVSALVARFREHGELLRSPREIDTQLPDWLIRDTLSTAEACIRLFNTAAQQSDHQWALLFDEMELAPPRVTESVLDAMRGSQSVLLYKLSLSPVQPEFARLNMPLAGVHGQDFELIRLSSQYSAAPRFAEDIIEAELRKRYVNELALTSRRVFGAGRFASVEEDEDPYAIGSWLWKRYDSLAKSDDTFADWLAKKGVDLHALQDLTPNERAAKVRKIRNIVVLREHYRRPHQTGRKSHDLYTGAEGLATLVDANPRLLMALLGHVLPRDLPRTLPLDRAAQSAAIDSVIDRFLALLRSQPAVQGDDGRLFQVVDLVEAIGKELGRRLISGPFDDNPVTAFRVDRRSPPHVISALQIALNVGAIVHLPDDSNRPIPDTLEGELFRLSFVLAPRYRLPLRLGEHRGLRSIVTRGDARAWYFPSGRSRRDRGGQALFDFPPSRE